MKSISPRRMVAALVVAALAAAMVVSVALAGDSNEPASPSEAQSAAASKNIVETAVAAGDFDTLVSLVGKAGLAETLAGEGPFTVFAPTDAAFDRVPRKTLSALAADPEQLESVLLYHVAKGELRASRVVKRSSIRTLNGSRVRVKVKSRGVRVNNAKVAKANVDASNGVIHVINRVLIPKD